MRPSRAVAVFLGGAGSDSIGVEGTLAGGLRAAAFDSIERALASGAFERAVLAVDRPERAAGAPEGVEIDVDRGPFHFGRRLREVIERRGIDSLLYFGAGSAPLLTSESFAGIAAALGEQPGGAFITNNLFSSDLVAFRTAGVLDIVEETARDNALARVLRDGGGLEGVELMRTCETQFDIDSPGDLAILSLRNDLGPRLDAFVRAAGFDTGVHRRAASVLADRDGEALVAGRVGSHVWRYLEGESACRVRVLSEERGMEAAGRAAGEARSLLGLHLERAGFERFFADVGGLCDAAFIDTRVLLSHARQRASREDRFRSDLLRPDGIANPWLRELTAAAAEAPVPVVLGGHSLMSGGLMSLVETAWAASDRAYEPRQ